MAKIKLNAPLRVFTKKGSKKRVAIAEALVWNVEEDDGRTIIWPTPIVGGDASPVVVEEDFDTVVSRLNTFCR